MENIIINIKYKVKKLKRIEKIVEKSLQKRISCIK